MRWHSLIWKTWFLLLVTLTGACSGCAADTLSSKGDEFNNPTTLAAWNLLDRRAFSRLDISHSSQGQLTVVPAACVWYMDQAGTMLYKPITGDFIADTYVTTRSRVNPAAPPSQPFNSAGIIARDPASGHGHQNWMVVNVGFQQNGTGTEVKSTVNSISQLRLVNGAPEGEVRLCRLGDTFFAFRKLRGEAAWVPLGSLRRPDLPQKLQVGLMSNGYGTNPDLLAHYDYIRFAEPAGPGDLTRDLAPAPGQVGPADASLAAPQVDIPGPGAQVSEPPADPAARVGTLNGQSTAPLQAAVRSSLGANLTGLNDWSTEFTFVDCFKMSRPWMALTTNWQPDSRPLDLDEHGWIRSLQPGQMARTLLFWGGGGNGGFGGHYPGGRYVVQYEGAGTIVYSGGARRVESSPGRDVLQVDPAMGGISFLITAIDPADHLRNIHMLMPMTVPAGEIFYSPFLNTLKNYRVLRFEHWMLGQSMEVMQQHWEERPRMEDARWTVKGAPVEVMVALANRLGADPWFCIPHLSDDNYVRQFAMTVRRLLDPRLKIYVEHSNEVWNGAYPQARYARQQGMALGLSTNPMEAGIRYHALRSRQIFAIWEAIFPRERLVRVLGSFASSPAASRTALSYGDTAAHTDALAIAPYFGILPQDQGQLSGMTLDRLMEQLRTGALPEVQAAVRTQAAIAAQYGVRLVAYEGGQHLVAEGPLRRDPQVNALMDAANRDPRMGSLYSTYLQNWVDAGGDLFVHYCNCAGYSPYGRFGSLEFLDEPRTQAPKYDALQRFIETHPGRG